MALMRNRSRRNYKLLVIVSFLILIFQYYLYDKHRNQLSEWYSPLCPYAYQIMDKRIIFDNLSYAIHHYPEFICPQNFRNMADWIYGWPVNVFNEQVQNSTHKINETVAVLPHGSIIYIKTDSLPDFFSNIYPHFRNKFVLITGQSILQAPGKHLHYLMTNDSKIIHWFGQNGNINASTSERFTHIPLGKDIFILYTYKREKAIAVYNSVGISDSAHVKMP